MLQPQATKAEPPVQPKFSFAAAIAGIVLFAAIIRAHQIIDTLPNRPSVPPTVAQVRLEPVELPSAGLEPLKLVGAWQLTSVGARIAGVSGLAVDGQELVAIMDTGTVVRMPKQLRAQMPALVFDLPSGPGDARLKFNRDSEAILRDPSARGWWVAFENHNELWLFDPAIRRALRRISIPGSSLGINSGIEGLASEGAAVLAFPESGGGVLRLTGAGWRQARLDQSAPVSDAVALHDGLVLLVQRRLTLLGFRNTLTLVDARGRALQTLWRKRLPVSWRDNVEAIATERTADGYRLWLATDDNFHPRLRTLLMVIDLPAAARRGGVRPRLLLAGSSWPARA